MRSLIYLLPFLGTAAAAAAAQEFVPAVEGLTNVPSELWKGAEISYKKTSLCETTEGVSSYAGYVTLPKKLLPDSAGWDDDLAAHFFFWYFEAREDPDNAPTSFYIGGGPGSTSFDGVSDFPCFVNADSNSTTLNKNSWNNKVNMLYIEQPVQTGYSYVSLVNGTLNLLTEEFAPLSSKEQEHMPQLNTTFRQGTFDPKEPSTIPNNTVASGRNLWTFSQVFFNEFPKLRTSNKELSLWTQSYGGFFGPGVFEYFIEQNKRIEAKQATHLPHATTFKLATLGLNDACVDTRAMGTGYPTFAYNNTFGLEIYNKTVYEEVMAAVTDTSEKGCYGLIDRCRELADQGDPESFGNNKTVNAACVAASELCFSKLQGLYSVVSDRSAFDVTHSNLTVFPPAYRETFFNQRWVQQELGARSNFTSSSDNTVEAFFFSTGDPMRRSIKSLEAVLAAGVNVRLFYGDRDYRCNWFGGENVSLSLDFADADKFRKAGYEELITNSSYVGGLTREYGPLSFTRIYQAGHGVGGYQPETMYEAFDRAMFGKDIATGKVDLSKKKDYSTKGPSSVRDVLNKVPEPVENTCFVLEAPITCTNEQLEALVLGKAVIKDDIVVEPKGALPATIKSKYPSDTSETSTWDKLVKADKKDGKDKSAASTAKVAQLSGLLVVAATVAALM